MNFRKITSFSLIILIALFLSGCSLPFLNNKKKAALQVTAYPRATIFLDGQHLGQTPYFDEKLKPGEYTLKLVPEGKEALSWQKTIKLTPGVLSVVNQNFEDIEDQSSGYILNLEPLSQKNNAKVSIISDPDSAVVTIDGEPKGFTPLSLEDISENEHLLNIATPGFEEMELKAKTVKGYKLVINVQLARILEQEQESESEEASPSAELEEEETATKSAVPSASPKSKEATSSAEQLERPYVLIKDTPTGWLNVRSEPSTFSKEETILTKVHPGETYKFIESNETGWYKIEYEKDKEGWISGKYAELFN